MVLHRETRISEAIAHHAADFLARESAVASIITVTHAVMSPDLKSATIFITVLPQTREEEALTFAKRTRSDFRTYLRVRTRIYPTPLIDFEIDYGEKNRQRIDELTRK